MELIAFLLILIISLTIVDIALSFMAYILHKAPLNFALIRELSLFKLISSVVYVMVSWTAFTFGGRRVKEVVLIISFLICLFLVGMVWLNVISLYFT